jgi:hypothetical protein
VLVSPGGNQGTVLLVCIVIVVLVESNSWRTQIPYMWGDAAGRTRSHDHSLPAQLRVANTGNFLFLAKTEAIPTSTKTVPLPHPSNHIHNNLSSCLVHSNLYSRLTHPSILTSTSFVSNSFARALLGVLFVIVSAGLSEPLIHLISCNSRRS